MLHLSKLICSSTIIGLNEAAIKPTDLFTYIGSLSSTLADAVIGWFSTVEESNAFDRCQLSQAPKDWSIAFDLAIHRDEKYS